MARPRRSTHATLIRLDYLEDAILRHMAEETKRSKSEILAEALRNHVAHDNRFAVEKFVAYVKKTILPDVESEFRKTFRQRVNSFLTELTSQS